MAHEIRLLVKFAATILISLAVGGFLMGVSLFLVDKIFGVHLQGHLQPIAYGLSTVIVLWILWRDFSKSRGDDRE